jgi:endonuclease/exonuclease/phosphatase family metal-dependent hydrolase
VKNSACFVLFVIILLQTSSCEKDVPVADTKHSYFKNSHYNIYTDSSLCVVTYNIQLGFRLHQDPWDRNQTGGSPQQIHDIAEILRQVTPDIVLLQEVPVNRSNVEVKHFIEALADSMNMNFAYGGHGKNDVTGMWPVQGVWGNAILSRFPVEEIENIEVYRRNQYDCRSVLRAKIKCNEERSINVYCLHHWQKQREEMERTKDFTDGSKLPLILGGDFNRSYGNPDYELISHFQDIFGTINPGIDRIYSNFHDTVYQQGFISGSNTVSDHGAFYARLRLLPQ